MRRRCDWCCEWARRWAGVVITSPGRYQGLWTLCHDCRAWLAWLAERRG